jgi:CheY-like chemotaxis protein
MENQEFIPTCCFYPSTILMVDDNPDLLKDISFVLMSTRQKYKSKYSTSPQEIIQILQKQGNTLQQFLQKCVSSSEEYYEHSKSIVHIDIPATLKEVYRGIYKSSSIRSAFGVGG